MAIPQHHLKNFQQMLAAANNGDLGLVETTDAATGKPVYAICIMQRRQGGGGHLYPLATMIEGNPFTLLNPPDGMRPSNDAQVDEPGDEPQPQPQPKH